MARKRGRHSPSRRSARKGKSKGQLWELKQLGGRILRELESSPHPVSVTVLAERLKVTRPELDRALSDLGTQVSWSRVGHGGDRFYYLPRLP